ncbi:unnamed protein product [Malus baccata var. baccata]
MSNQANIIKRQKVVYGPPLPPLKRLRRSNNSDSNPVAEASSGSGSSSSKNAVGRVGSVELNHDVVHHILTLLPVDKCIKARGLATRFKDSWRFARRLHFGREFVKEFRLEPMEFADTVDRVFRFHKGPEIKSFHIYIDPDHDYVARIALKKWVSKCKEKGFEELDLEVFAIERFPDYFVPSRVLDVETLKVLKLTFCVFTLPPLGKGLSLLTTLTLTRVNIIEEYLQTIFNHCLLLETLDMTWCEGFRDLVVCTPYLKRFRVLKIANRGSSVETVTVYAPTLQYFYYTGQFPGFQIISQPMVHLKQAMIKFNPITVFTNYRQIENLVSAVCMVGVLTITGTFLEGLSPRCVNGRLKEKDFSLWNLKELHLILQKHCFCNVTDIACFLKNTPSLERLFIDMRACRFEFNHGPYWELHLQPLLETSNVGWFKFLTIIKIHGFAFEPHHMLLVNFIVQRAICLESLILIFVRNYSKTSPGYWQNYNHLQECFFAWRISSKARLSVYFSANDRSGVHPQHSRIWKGR